MAVWLASLGGVPYGVCSVICGFAHTGYSVQIVPYRAKRTQTTAPRPDAKPMNPSQPLLPARQAPIGPREWHMRAAQPTSAVSRPPRSRAQLPMPPPYRTVNTMYVRTRRAEQVRNTMYTTSQVLVMLVRSLKEVILIIHGSVPVSSLVLVLLGPPLRGLGVLDSWTLGAVMPRAELRVSAFFPPPRGQESPIMISSILYRGCHACAFLLQQDAVVFTIVFDIPAR